MATPALGPSLGMAPAGTWMCTSDFSNSAGSMPSSAARALTRVSAACALSFMTSPSWPVRMSLLLPGTRVASTNRISPPVGVQARPVATPGTLVRMATSFSKRRGPRIGGERRLVDAHALGAAFGDAHGDVPADRADVPFQIAHAGLARVVADDRPDRVVGDLALLRR